MERKEKGDAYMPDKLKDLVRTTIIADRRNIDIVIEQLRMSEPVKAFKGIAVKKQRPQNYLGYSGNIVNLQTSNGLVAEIQVNTAKMIYAKELPENAKAILGEKLWNKIH